MKRMKEADVKALFAFVANETEYDLLQIQPKDFNELTVCLVLTLDSGQHAWDVLIISARKISKYRSSLHTKGYLINYQSIII